MRDHDLLHACKVSGESGRHHRNGASRAFEPAAEQLERSFDPIAPVRRVDQVRQHQQVENGNRARRRLRSVVLLFHAKEDRRVAAIGAEPPARLLIPEQFILAALQGDRPLQPHRLAFSLEQLEQTVDQIRIIFGVAGNVRLTVAVAPKECASIRVPHPVADERRGAHGGAPVRSRGCRTMFAERRQDSRCTRKRRNHQTVPRGQYLVVTMRPRAL